MYSLLLAVENKYFAKLKEFVEEGAEVQEIGSFKLNDHHSFENVPSLYAAMISGQDSMVYYLFSKLVINLDDTDSLILPTDTDVEQETELQEVVCSALIFHGNSATREQGRQCWKKALKMPKIKCDSED
jgi:hypothetical protein